MFWFIEGKQLNYFEHESKKIQGQRIFPEITPQTKKQYFWKKTTTS